MKQSASARNSESCSRSGIGDASDRGLAICLTSDDPGVAEPQESSNLDVTVFVDRSASMQGFLDPAFPTRVPTDYRSVIDKVLVGLNPSSAFSFGTQVRPITANIGTLGDRAFYSDRDTQLEDVLAQVASDSNNARAYVIVTDGRRGSPTLSLAQYSSLRSTARDWIQRGGSIVVGASMAPFTTVAADPSGCRREEEAAADQRCPLYAFAFAPRGAERKLTGVVASAFENVFTWPALRITGKEQALLSPPVQRALQFERNWGPSRRGSPMVRSRGSAPTTQWSTLRLGLLDTSSVNGAGLLASLRGQHLRTVVHTRGFVEGPRLAWKPVTAAAGLLRQTPDDPLAVDLVTRGSANKALTLYRVDLLPDGYPLWLDRYDASDRNDRLRTFGLSVLFEGFRQEARGFEPDSAFLARIYVIAN